MKVLRSYLELDMFSGLTVQTESTIETAMEEFTVFDRCLNVSTLGFFIARWLFAMNTKTSSIGVYRHPSIEELELPEATHTRPHDSRYLEKRCHSKLQYEARGEGECPTEEDIPSANKFQRCGASGE